MTIDSSMLTSGDLDILLQGDRFPVAAGPVLRSTGWRAGLWVKYVPDENDVNNFTVEQSEGIYATGFLLIGSENYKVPSAYANERNYTSYQNIGIHAEASGASVLTLIAGGGRFLFRVFETVALNGQGQRSGGPITYNLNDSLYVSENGLLTNDDPARLALATGNPTPLLVGVCCKTPTGGKLGLDLKY